MGGYGALLLAELSTIVTTVAAESPAVWPSYEVAQSVNSTASTRQQIGSATA